MNDFQVTFIKEKFTIGLATKTVNTIKTIPITNFQLHSLTPRYSWVNAPFQKSFSKTILTNFVSSA
jgi:hypothetical protein